MLASEGAPPAPPEGGGEPEALHPEPVHPSLTRSRVSLRLVLLLSFLGLLIIAVTTVGAYLFAQTQEPVGVAEVQLDIDLTGLGSAAAIERRLASVEVLTRSALVQDVVSEATGIPPLELNLRAETIGRSSVVRLWASDPDPDRALTIVTLATERLIELVSTTVDSREKRSVLDEIAATSQALEDVRSRLTEIDDERAQAAEGGSVFAPVAEEQALLTELETLSTRLAGLEERRLDLRLAEDQRALDVALLGDPRLISEARPIPELQAIALGGFVGLFLASFMVVLIWQIRRRPSLPVEAAAVQVAHIDGSE